MNNNTEIQSQGLPARMHELVRDINGLIDRCISGIAAITSRQTSLLAEADNDLTEAKKIRDQVIAELSKVRNSQKSRAQTIRNNVDNADKGALDHLQKQSVDHSSLLSLGTQRFGARKEALDEAERLFKEPSVPIIGETKSWC